MTTYIGSGAALTERTPFATPINRSPAGEGPGPSRES